MTLEEPIKERLRKRIEELPDTPETELLRRRASAVHAQRWKSVGTDSPLDARQICDPAMDSVDCEHDAVKHADPHDDVGRPSVTYHFIDETVNAQVVRLVLGDVERLAALPIDRAQLAERLIARARVAHEAGKQRRRPRQLLYR